VHLCVKGLSKDPETRFQSARELIEKLNGILEGNVMIQCQFTFSKRLYRELGRLNDRAPFLAFALLVGTLGAVVFTAVQLVRMAVS
jgi:hypothetical protein